MRESADIAPGVGLPKRLYRIALPFNGQAKVNRIGTLTTRLWLYSENPWFSADIRPDLFPWKISVFPTPFLFESNNKLTNKNSP